MVQVIFTEPKTLKPRQVKLLEEEGFIVLVVDDVDKVKMIEQDLPVATPRAEDGFKLNA